MPGPRLRPAMADSPTAASARHDAERALLERLRAGETVSGDLLAGESGTTRAAVWKRIAALREAGVAIDARAGQGYALVTPVELLDVAALRAALPPTAAAGLASLGVAWTLDSTNAELMRRPPPRTGAAVLLAERQTGGRGRRGRAWASPLAANLYCSVLRTFDGGLARLGGLGIAAGVAVAEALQAAGYPQVRLKWPNDLVVADGDGGLRKLGGLLVEGGGEHAGPVRAVVGIGINVRMPDASAKEIDQPWTDLHGLDPEGASRNAAASAVLAALLPALDLFGREGLAPFLPRFAACDALAGRPVRVLAGDGDLHGIARGLAADGGLRLAVDGGERVVHAGEVSVRAEGGR